MMRISQIRNRIALLLVVVLSVILHDTPVALANDVKPDVKSQTVIVGVPSTIQVPQEARDIIVGDPTLLDSMISSGRNLILTGKAQGLTTVTINDLRGNLLMTVAVRIDPNLADINDIITRDLGLTDIRIRAAKQAIILSGTVSSASDAEKAEDTVRAYFGMGAKADAASPNGRIINTIKIADREQVMLRVVVSEVQRSLLKQLGIDTQGNWSIGEFSLAEATGFGTTHTPTTVIAPGIKTKNVTSTTTLKALERAGYLKTLAEPTLTAISGESAKFTAGGEIPVPTGDFCSTNATGTQSCQTNYGYKPIGVTLAFTPIVLNGGRISLHINTEVTEIDPDNGSRTNSGSIPAFRSRKMETTVELASGAALMSAGLIQHQSSTTYDRVPGLGTIPVLGQLFQSNDYQNHQTELLISVVPYIAKPFGALEQNGDDQDYIGDANSTRNLIDMINAAYGLKARAGNAHFGFEVK